MRQLFLDIQNLLAAIPALRYTGEACGQLDPARLAADPAEVEFPCALVTLGSAAFPQAGSTLQHADATVEITVADRPATLPASGDGSPAAETAEPFAVYALLEQVNAALHGHSGDSYTRLSRTALARIARTDTIREFRISYRTGLSATGAPIQTTPHPTPPDIVVATPAGR